jgi:hypothetical protein
MNDAIKWLVRTILTNLDYDFLTPEMLVFYLRNRFYFVLIDKSILTDSSTLNVRWR